MAQKIMSQIQIGYTLSEYLDRVYDKSNSERSRNSARISVNHFETYCKHENLLVSQVIDQFRTWIKENQPENIYAFLDKWVKFMTKDHEDIEQISKFGELSTLKKHSSKTIRSYFAFIKSWLRLCHKIRLLPEDITDYIQFPKDIKEQRKALELETIKKILENSSKKRRCLYLVLMSSGMRIGEAVALKKKNFDLESNLCKITIPAVITKTREGRESYISNEAKRLLLKITKNLNDNDLVFGNSDNNHKSVLNEDQIFHKLRNNLGLSEKYDNSTRFTITIHAFRRFFHTKASNKHGSDYANAMDGHSGYLKQYYALEESERIKKYLELEPNLSIYSTKTETEKDKKITEMEKEMDKMKNKMARLELMYEVN